MIFMKMKIATGKNNDVKISLKHSIVVCKHLVGKKSDKAVKLLEDLVAGKRNLDGKHFTKAAKEILSVLKTAEANAKVKGLDADKLYVKVAKVDKGFRFVKPTSRFRFRGRKSKSSSIEIKLEER